MDGGRAHPTIALVCVAALVVAAAACGKAAGNEGIALLPNRAAAGNTWHFTPACRFAPVAVTGCAPARPTAGVAELAGDEWNLGTSPAARGSVSMSIDHAGALAVRGDLSSAPPCTDQSCITTQGNTWVRGYPSVLYGIDQCNASTSPPQSPRLRLPMAVRSLPAGLIGSTTYDSDAGRVTYDIGYDLWLNASSTATPCRTSGTLEVMVWTDYGARALLPDSMKVATVSIPRAVNGAADRGGPAWSVFVSNLYPDGRTGPWGATVWLVPDRPHTVRSGAVSVDLAAALGTVGTLLERNYGWRGFTSSYWLDTIAFGMEFGPPDANPYGDGPASFALNLTSYCLDAGTTVAATRC